MTENVTNAEVIVEKLVQAISEGLNNLHIDNDQMEEIVARQIKLTEQQIKLQEQKNRKWSYISVIAAIAVVVIGYNFYKTITAFEEDMNSMEVEMRNMSNYMKSMSTDMAAMKASMATMQSV
jgi:hypothetical protein